MTRICHLSSAHRGLDIRIFHKECVSLASAGFDTHLVIFATIDEVARAAEKGVTIHPLRPVRGRFLRMTKHAWHCYLIGRKLQAEIYHFHDPELLPYGILMALNGKKVVYDVHEDVPQHILSKEWIIGFLRKPLSLLIGGLEYIGAKFFFNVVAATPFIAERFTKITPYTVNINNYAIIGELSSGEVSWAAKKNQVCYIGGLTYMRGIDLMILSMTFTKGIRLKLAGSFRPAEYFDHAKNLPGYSKTDYLGELDRKEVSKCLRESRAGLITAFALPNAINSQPIKMFEYMSAGLPVIASNFPLWRNIVEGNDCGLCVNPLDVHEVARAINYLVNHPEDAERMGRNGQRAVQQKYNWSIEELKLLRFYKNLK
jgi:glycosyltransferase involved in cell wall biosynthesis